MLLIHGIHDTEVLFNRLRLRLQALGKAVHCVNLTPNNGDAGIDTLAEQVGGFVDANFGKISQFDVVAFSMGGLVARYYVQRLGGASRVRRLITLATPHNGTYTAFLRGNAGARQMRPGSEFLRRLNSDAHMLNDIEFISIWTPLDLMIVPARSSVMPVGRNVRFAVAAHPLMVRSRRVLNSVVNLLR